VRILVVKPTALGDVAQALSVAPILKQWPGRAVHLAWLVDGDYAPLLRLCPWVDEIIIFPRRYLRSQGCSPLAWLRWLSSLRQHEFDLVLDLQGLARSALMSRSVRAKRRVGLQSAREFSRLAYDELVPDVQRHAVDRYLAAARQVMGDTNRGGLNDHSLLAEPQGELPAGLQAGNYTLVHPYSLWETKLWPWRNYEQLAKLLPGEQFVLVGQGGFFPVAAPNVTDLRGGTDLQGLLQLAGKSRAVISTDSGPLHLAAAFDKPLLALFGATDPDKTAPRAQRVKVLTNDLKCRPCLQRRCAGPRVMECLQGITPEQVAGAWKALAS
jgi:ADP-heptose:LPS heptosyltransferase